MCKISQKPHMKHFDSIRFKQMDKKKSILKKHILLIIVLFNLLISYAQSNAVNFHELDIHGVLFNKKVKTLFRDSFGYLWIGSDSGLYKYDGHNLTEYQYDAFNPHSLPNININSIIEDASHNLWIGSESYLIYYNRKENKFKGFLKNITSTIKEKTKEGDIWVKLQNFGLLKILTKDINHTDLLTKFKPEHVKNSYETTKNVSSIIEDSFGRSWIGTNEGMYTLNSNGEFIATNFKGNIVNIKLFDKNKILAITINSMYVLGYNKSDNKIEVLESYPKIIDQHSSKGTLTTSAINNKNNNIWIGTTDGLIKANRVNNKFEFKYYSKKQEKVNLLNNNITSTIFDTYGNLWIGSFKGINKHIGRTSLFEYNQISTNNNQSISICNQNANNLLVAMSDGIYRFNTRTKKHVKIKSQIKTANIITKNYDKTEYFVTDNFNIYKTENYLAYKTNVDLVKIKTYKKAIRDMIPISKNELWVALWAGGVDVINSENSLSEFKKLIIKKLENNHTSTLLLTTENKLWIGTRGEGLYMIDLINENFKHYLPTLKNGLTSNAILSLHEDKTGNIWIGTRGGGLNMYDQNLNTFRNFKEIQTNSPKIVLAIEEDSNGNIWMSTRKGITMLDLTTQRFISFGVEDGINENQFIFNSSTKNDQKNIFYFGCPGGFYSVDPTKLITQEALPKTVITSFSTLGTTPDNRNLNNKLNKANSIDINSENPIVLSYDKNNILVNFSSLDLTAPNKNEYAYKLKGLNNYWIYTSAFNRNANYNDLPPGNYTFMVKSSNSDGLWNETPTEIKFKIEPPIWKSKWALLFYFIFVTFILYISSILIKRWYHLKENLVKETISREKDNEHNRMKMIFFTDISHELRTPLSLILGTIEKIVKEKKFTLTPVSSQRIYNNTLRMHRLINQIMDIRKYDGGQFKLKVSKNDIVKDINIIKNAFNDFAEIYHIKYDFVSEKIEIIGWYDVDILEKILFNLLSNAFKYTKEKGEISVHLDLINSEEENYTNIQELKKGTYIKCSVKDNGIGIPKKELESIFDRYYQATAAQRNQIPGTGIGMELVQKLITRHHGVITVESEENINTSFTFYLPINKKRYPKKERILTGTPLKKNFIKSSEFQIIKEESSVIETEQVQKKTTSKPTVLIVEDHDELRTMVKEELSADFTIIEASNGKEGLEIALKEKPELIISDILMPIEDGLSMLKQLKKRPELQNTPIFMLTAKHAEETKIECLSLGANDYIEKPFSLEFLKWKVVNMLATRKELKEKYSKLITTAPSNIDVDSNDEKFIKKLIKIIEENINNNILNVEFVASEIGMSRANLYRKVQSILNDTPVNFIKTIKLKRAAQLLKKNQMYISEVAYMTGFNNQKYFSKCFSKEYGMSPTEFIKKNHENNIEEESEGI